MILRIFAAALVVTLTLSNPGARAQDAPLDATREHVLYARYDEAEVSARAALDRHDLTAAQRNELLELLATAQLANRNEDDARATMRTLYSRDPEHRLMQRDASPPVVAAFARAREEHARPLDIDLSVDSTWLGSNAELGNAVRVMAHGNEHGDAIVELRLYYRDGAHGAFTRLLMDNVGNGIWSVEIPANRTRIGVEYYVEALAPSRHVLDQSGSPTAPLSRATPWPEVASAGEDDAWIWGLVFGAVALVGAGVAVGVVLAQPGPEQGSLGTLVLTRM